MELRRVLEEKGVDVCKSGAFEYMSIDDLYGLAKEKKVKYYLKKSKRELAEAVGLDCSGVDFANLEKVNKNPTGIILKDEETGDVLRFRSINYAAKMLKVNSGSIFYRLKNGKPLEIDGRFYSVMYGCEDV